MLRKLALGLVLYTSPAVAGEYKLLTMESFEMKYSDFKSQRDPYAMEYTEDWAYRAATSFRYSILGVLYHDNYVHCEGLDSGVVKTVGWQWTIGLRLHRNVDVFADHHSRHVMEDYRPTVNGRNQFPVEDSYGIKFIVVEDTGKHNWIFGK